MIYEGLTRLDYYGKPQEALAERIETIDDRNMKFELREAYWTNGDRITSEDFLRSWSTVLDPLFPSENAYQLFPIKNAREIKYGRLPKSALGVCCSDEKTLCIELENPTPYFCEVLAFDSYYPFHAKTEFISQRNALPSITCGPFQLQSWKVQNEMVLSKNPQYWDVDNVEIDGIHIAIMRDEAASLYLFERGELDYLGSPLSPLPQEEMAVKRQQGKLKCLRGCATYWFMLNTHKPPLTNVKVRRALAMALNRHALECVLEDGFIPAYWVLPPSLSSGNPPLIRDESISRAKELFMEGLGELKMDVADCEVTLMYQQSHLHRRVVQVVQQQWQQALGIKVHLVTMDWGEFNRRLKRKDFQIARYGWQAQFNDPICFLELFTSPQAISGYNFSGWENHEYDKLITSIRQTSDAERRRRLVAQAEALLMSEMPIIPVFFQSFCYLKSSNLKRIVLTPNGKIDFRWAFFETNSKHTDKEKV